ncbi:MAG: response regulator [Chloroflexi bacterium]|nr:response regulator [Chloroflexota bacterium]
MSDHSPSKRILIVDDDPDFLEYTRIVLTSAGYLVDTATSAAEAMTLVHSSDPDLIIIDVMMSYSLEGIGLARELKCDPELVKIPLLVVTSIARNLDAIDFDEGTRRAIEGFFTKPVSPYELLTTIGGYLAEGGTNENHVTRP